MTSRATAQRLRIPWIRNTGLRASAVQSAARLLLAALATGVAAGLGGVVLTWALHAVQHVAFGYTEDTFLTGVEQAGPLRRVVAVGLGGCLAGLGWWWLRTRSASSPSVTHAIKGDGRLPLRATVLDALLQILAVGAGGSLGREGAPRQVGAALGGHVAGRLGLSIGDRRVLLASGAGAGLAAVYNVPFAGAVFTLEVLLASRRLRAVVVAVVASVAATACAAPFLGTHSTYDIGPVSGQLAVVGGAGLVGVCGGLIGLVVRRLMTAARTHAPHSGAAAATIGAVFFGLGGLAILVPQLLGNGKNLSQLTFDGSVGLGAAAILTALKPVVTALCLRSGAIGGILTPSFTTGATLGFALAGLAGAGGHAVSTALTLAGAASVLATAQRAPFTAAVLTLDLTHAPLAGVVVTVVAVVGAMSASHAAATVRRYSARPGRLTG